MCLFDVVHWFCVSVCVHRMVNQTSFKRVLNTNTNSSKTVKGTEFKFDTRVPRDMTLNFFPKGGVARVT